jgi:nucleotide-binding universal stress UspA family protein
MLPFKKILCPTDFSEPSYKALSVANELALYFPSELLVVHVVAPVPLVPAATTVPLTFNIPVTFNIPEYQHELEISSRKTLEDLVKKRVPEKICVRTIVVLGDPADQIVKVSDEEKSEKELHQVFLFYSLHQTGASYRLHHVHLLPVDEEWLKRLTAKSWPTQILPTYTMDRDSLFSALIREYLFISLFRAFAESLASENASRLSSMQAAEKNIEEQLSELKKQFHQMRQMVITEELLDIVAGFEALTGKKRTISTN